MTAPPADQDRSAAVKRVNDTLRGPVAEVLSDLIPELAGLGNDEIYDRVLDTPDLLSQAFTLFRQQRHRFRHVVRDANNRPVLDDTVVLSCGRTLEEIIAMVVRTSAKRYFRRAQPLLTADELYDAIKDFLMHEWQVPLVPTYADMTPETIRDLGARLLIIREAQQLRDLPAAPAATVLRPDADDFNLFLTLDGQHLRAEAFQTLLERGDVIATLPYAAPWSDIFKDVGGPAARILVNGLNLTPEQLCVVLVWAYAHMGEEVFVRLLGHPGQPELVTRLVQHGLATGIQAATPLDVCANFIPGFLQKATTSRPREMA